MSADDIDVSKLKVPELRAELSKRGLNTFGTRQVLVDRLSEAMSANALLSDPKTSLESGNAHFNMDTKMEPSELSEVTQDVGNEIGNGIESPDQRQRSDADHKRKRSPSPRRRSRSRDRDGRRSPRRRSRSPSSRTRMCEEKLGWEESTCVVLDSYNCDLSLLIDTEGFSAKPQTEGGFSMMWAGVRANYGLVSGKAFFEVRCSRHINVDNLDSLAGGAAHVTRIGWSTDNTDFALGEEPQSYGYGGTGKKSCNGKFCDYGCVFGEGDVVGAFLEWTPSEALLRFCVNGVDQGECYRIQKCTLGERPALFPHIYVKNVEFSVNFGQNNQPPWFTPKVPNDDPSSWPLISNTSPLSRVRGRKPPASKAECEVIMMVGLPGSGKTYFAERFRSEHRDKQFNVLGTNLILDKMKVMGLARQRNYHGRWDVLIDKATKCLNALITMASMRRRNYILDQTNVYPSAQRRKMRPFEGFKRKAIVIVPTDEEFRRRIAQREKEEGKEVPESAVLEMKANFGIPKPISEDPSSVFDEVIFTELNSTEAKELVDKYNQEGQAHRPPPEKRQRWDGSRDQDDSRDSRSRGYESRDRGRDYGRGRRDDFRRSPRRDDRGRWEYRGGYSAERDRGRDSDRYDRGRDRDSYGHSTDRFGSSGGRFGGPGRGAFPPGMNYGGYGGPRGGGMVARGGPVPPMGPGAGRGYGGPAFHGGGGPPVDYRGTTDGRPPRGGRGGFRGGPSAAYGGPVDSSPMYGAPHSQFDVPTGKNAPTDPYGAAGGGSFSSIVDSKPPESTGGYRGAYGPPSRGQYGGSSDSTGYGGQAMGRGANIASGRGGRGAGPGDRDGPAIARGGHVPRGASAVRGGYSANTHGGYQGDADASGYPIAGADRTPTYSSYQGTEDYSERARDRFPVSDTGSYGSVNQQAKNSGSFPVPRQSGYSGGYHRGGPPSYPTGGQQSYPVPTGNYSSESQAAYSGNYTGSEGYPNSGVPEGVRGARSTGHSAGGSQGVSSRGYPSSDTEKPPIDAQHNERAPDAGSLYASGSARYGETQATQPSAGGPKQSRFDSKPAPAGPQGYSSYPPGSYSGPYGATYGGGTMNNPGGGTQPTAPNSANLRNARSRFDLGPSANQATSASAAGPQDTQSQSSGQSQQPPSQPSQTPQSYYGYGTQAAKQPTGVSAPAAPSQSFSTYGYNYGSYGGSYANQTGQPATTQGRSSAVPSSTPSLYASAVADKPPSAAHPTPSVTTQPSSTADTSAALAAAAYTSYYGYGSTAGATGVTVDQQPNTGKLDAAMAAAQQFNTWQQQPSTGISASVPATTVAQTAGSATSAYTGYYAGFAAYPTGYGTTGAPAPPASQVMPPYYGGYR